MRISDWSSDVCSSDLDPLETVADGLQRTVAIGDGQVDEVDVDRQARQVAHEQVDRGPALQREDVLACNLGDGADQQADLIGKRRSEEHTSELQSLMRISYAVFCLQKKTHNEFTSSSHKYKQSPD